MHSNNQVDFPQRFAPEQRQMLFRRQAQPAVCHPNLPLTPCYAGRIPQMFSNRAMERGKHKGKKKKRLKILIRNWGPFFASSLTWNANTLPIKKVAPEKREGGRERERKSKWNLIFRGRGNVQVGSRELAVVSTSPSLSPKQWALTERFMR